MTALTTALIYHDDKTIIDCSTLNYHVQIFPISYKYWRVYIKIFESFFCISGINPANDLTF